MKYQIYTAQSKKLIEGIRYLLIISFFLIFQYTHAQEQWRVFTPQNSGLPSFNVGSIAIDTNNIIWIGTDSGLVRFDGNNWTVFDTTNSGLPRNKGLSLAIDEYNYIWIGVGEKGLVKFDGLNNWSVYDTNNSGLPSNLIRKIYLDSHNQKWICTTNKGLVKFDNITWTVYDTNNSGVQSNITWDIVIKNDIKWIGTFSRGVSIFNDTSWIIYNIYNSGLPSDVIKSVTIDYMNNLWVATQFGGAAKFNYELNQWWVYNTTNSGIPENNLYTILTDKHRKWIGTQSQGLAYYDDTSWVIFNTLNSLLPGNTVTYLSLDSNKNLWISTVGGLAIYNENGVIGVNNSQIYLPKDFVLNQNYPNPFNPVTNIKYQIVKDSYLKLLVYDILGKEIYSTNEFKKAGIYSITFDGSKYASGIYLYRLESGSYTETKKMVLVK